MTVSIGTNLHRDLSRIDETRRNITVEGGDLMVNEKNIDRQTHAHHMLSGQNDPHEIPEFLSGHVLAHREPTQPQNMIRQMSRDTTLPILENTHKRATNYHNTSNNRLAKKISRTASHQRPTTSALLEPASTNTLVLDGKNEKFELFEDLFHTS